MVAFPHVYTRCSSANSFPLSSKKITRPHLPYTCKWSCGRIFLISCSSGCMCCRPSFALITEVLRFFVCSHTIWSENEYTENATLQIKHVDNSLWLWYSVLTCDKQRIVNWERVLLWIQCPHYLSFFIRRAEENVFVSQDCLVLWLNFHCIILNTDCVYSAAISG